MSFVDQLSAAVKRADLALAAEIHAIAASIEAKYKADVPVLTEVIQKGEAIVADVEKFLGMPAPSAPVVPMPGDTAPVVIDETPGAIAALSPAAMPSIAAGLTPPNPVAG